MITAIDFAPGDIVRVHQRIKEGDKSRIQIFKGIVLGIRGRGINKMFTVQKMVGHISIERIWPVNSPAIEKVEIEKHPRKKIRHSRLNHLRVPKTS